MGSVDEGESRLTDSEICKRLRADLAAANARADSSRRDALGEAAKVCAEFALRKWHEYKCGNGEGRANPLWEGQSDGADSCDIAIRALINAEQNPEKRSLTPVAESQAPVTSEPGHAGVAPSREQAAPDCDAAPNTAAVVERDNGANVNLPELRGGLDSSGQVGDTDNRDSADVPKVRLIAEKRSANQPPSAVPIPEFLPEPRMYEDGIISSAWLTWLYAFRSSAEQLRAGWVKAEERGDYWRDLYQREAADHRQTMDVSVEKLAEAHRELARISGELGLPPAIGPAPGWLKMERERHAKAEAELSEARKRQHQSDINYDALEKRAVTAEAELAALKRPVISDQLLEAEARYIEMMLGIGKSNNLVIRLKYLFRTYAASGREGT